MPTKFHKPIASWYYNLVEKNIDFKSNIVSYKSFGLFSQILNILIESKLFVPTSIRYGNPIESKDLNGFSLFEILTIVNDLITNEDSLVFFKGKTLIINSSTDEWYEDIVGFFYSFCLYTCEIQLYSDIWLPIDRDFNIQIETAELNNHRLTDVLKKIKNLGYNEVFPEENQDYSDEGFKQHGFKIYLYERDVFSNYENREYDTFFLNEEPIQLTENQKSIIEKYLWINRFKPVVSVL